jgi:hypothetical protein
MGRPGFVFLDMTDLDSDADFYDEVPYQSYYEDRRTQEAATGITPRPIALPMDTVTRGLGCELARPARRRPDGRDRAGVVPYRRPGCT